MKGPKSGGDREGFSLPSSVEAIPRMLQSPGSFGSIPRYQTKKTIRKDKQKGVAQPDQGQLGEWPWSLLGPLCWAQGEVKVGSFSY